MLQRVAAYRAGPRRGTLTATDNEQFEMADTFPAEWLAARSESDVLVAA